MTDTKPGADELRIRSILKQRGVGPDALPPPVRPPMPAVPPKPVVRPRDWLDDILDEPPAEAAAPEEQAKRPWWKAKRAPEEQMEAPAEPQTEPETDSEDGDESGGEAPNEPGQPTKQQAKTTGKRRGKQKRPAPGTARTAWDTQPVSPRQALIDAWARVPYRLKWLIQHAIAAAVGWRLGWVQWGTDTAAWYATGHWTTPSAWVLYGLGAAALALYSRTRTWRWLVACATAVPVSSVVAGVLLYGTGYHP